MESNKRRASWGALHEADLGEGGEGVREEKRRGEGEREKGREGGREIWTRRKDGEENQVRQTS